jgi:chemotaxis protein MotB
MVDFMTDQNRYLHQKIEGIFASKAAGEDGLGLWATPESGDKSGRNSWVLAWSDLMMVLFVLFCVLFIYSLNHRDVVHKYHGVAFARDAGYAVGKKGEPLSGTEAGPPAGSSMHSLFSRLDKEFSSFSAEKVRVGFTRGNQIVLRLRNKYLFEPGSSNLSKDLPVLEKISTVLKIFKNEVQVRGHAYSHPSGSGDAWELSAQRAGRIARYFTERQNIAPERFSILALADTNPITPGKDSRAREENSRIEIRILEPTVSSRK